MQLLNAQLTDLARLEYSFIPSSRSEDQYTRLRAMLNYPIKIKNDSYFIVGGEYNRIILNLNEPYPFDTRIIDRLHIIDLNLGYTFKTSAYWRLGFQFNPRIASTLETSITNEDIFFNGGVFAIHDKTDATDVERPFRLIVGLTYNTTVGIPFPLPFVSYYRKINQKWSYTAGIPKSNVKYFVTEKAIIQTFAALDGYFANLQQSIIVNRKKAENISLSVAVAGLGFEYFLTKHLVAYTYTGYTFRLDNVLRNNDRDEIFRLNNLNAFYLRTGIKFKI
ncbi:hypothetical protein J4050_05660 [Winogradskyella sp. DF17]|uniref:DUF6268 domain-containing protein n=2 Tax=Winogradskyella pelagia TaxID=2819984 RepID=A0ABS3T195_9FLAO|nr:hypothetical protein [Winogradskyella sp. DF17]